MCSLTGIASRSPVSLLDGRPIGWLPLVEVTETHLWVGLTAEGEWVTGGRSGAVVVYEDGPISRAWITVLEKPIDELSAEFKAKVEILDLPISLRDTPMKNTVIEGTQAGRARWVSAALEWVNRDMIDDQYRDALRVAAKSPGAGQKNRQAAWRILRRCGATVDHGLPAVRSEEHLSG